MILRRSETSGFTLIELMIIVVIMGIVLAMTAPGVSRFVASSRLAGARSALMGDLRYARSLATTGGGTYEMRLDSTSYSIVRVSPSSTVLRRSPSWPTGRRWPGCPVG